MSKNNLAEIRKIYKTGGNIIEYLKRESNQTLNTKEIIETSYDFQSGSYIKKVQGNIQAYNKYFQKISDVINSLGIQANRILEAGVGEATTLGGIVEKLNNTPRELYGFDISWSRIKCGLTYLDTKNIKANLFTGDLFDIPILDNSIDIVYTAHSIEPNGGKEKEALESLLRITGKYLILLEPGYEFASPEGKLRMKSHGYITNLYQTAVDMGLNIIEHRLFESEISPLNPTGLIIIRKDEQSSDGRTDSVFMCPTTKTPLELIRNNYYTTDGMLIYPVVDGVPCLRKENAIIGTHYLNNLAES